MSQLTTHILDTSAGKPAARVRIVLEQPGTDGSWQLVAEGKTNEDGRIPDFLKKEMVLAPGMYRLHFDTAAYFSAQQKKCFYPYVQIVFEITDASHYHVPLLLNPYGYSTYRGS